MLETVGVFEAPKQHGKYETGQVSCPGEQSMGKSFCSSEGCGIAVEGQKCHSLVFLVSAVLAVCQSSDSSKLIRICNMPRLFIRWYLLSSFVFSL